MVVFDDRADAYDAARPGYPDSLYDRLETATAPLAGLRVLDGGAGTGVATRQLRQRGAVAVALDAGLEMLRRARGRDSRLAAVLADAGRAPLATSSFDLCCFAQSWHWMDQAATTAEVSRLLVAGGWWAAWWSHPWADDQVWFDRYQTLLESQCTGYSRRQREVDWAAAAVAAHGAFQPPQRHIVPWTRRVSVSDWLVDLASHSYVIGLAEAEAQALMADVAALLQRAFPSGTMVVAYQTRLWVARRIPLGGGPSRPTSGSIGPERPR